MQTLVKEDADLFYEMWRVLLHQANLKWKMYPDINYSTDEQIDVSKTVKLAKKIWENKEVIDECLSAHPELPERQRQIMNSWKKAVHGNFIIERHLQSGSIFIMDGGEVYRVLGIISSYEEIFWMHGLPVYVEATILPFEGKLITDGLMNMRNIFFGPGIRKSFKEQYSNAKREKRIITSFPEDEDEA
ncbi:MAG: hypothetical protein IJ719_01470 [Clostridia bacterium]|nr:hypothetical protein [Clostridia bacterium]